MVATPVVKEAKIQCVWSFLSSSVARKGATDIFALTNWALLRQSLLPERKRETAFESARTAEETRGKLEEVLDAPKHVIYGVLTCSAAGGRPQGSFFWFPPFFNGKLTKGALPTLEHADPRYRIIQSTDMRNNITTHTRSTDSVKSKVRLVQECARVRLV